MPWIPELFSAPALQHLQDQLQRELVTVPFLDGVMTGEVDALIRSFAGEPELHHPVRGRVRGATAFTAFAEEMRSWLTVGNFSFDEVEHVHIEGHGFEEGVLHLDGEDGRVDLPLAIVADREPDGHVRELRLYFSSWPLSGRHLHRPPLLQPATGAPLPDIVGEYQRALADGDVNAVLAAFEPDGYAREPAGGRYLHAGSAGLRAFYGRLFSNGGGIPLEHCGIIDDGRACALEYNVVHWGTTELAPEAGVAVYVRGESGRLAAARIYDDADPPMTDL